MASFKKITTLILVFILLAPSLFIAPVSSQPPRRLNVAFEHTISSITYQEFIVRIENPQPSSRVVPMSLIFEQYRGQPFGGVTNVELWRHDSIPYAVPIFNTTLVNRPMFVSGGETTAINGAFASGNNTTAINGAFILDNNTAVIDGIWVDNWVPDGRIVGNETRYRNEWMPVSMQGGGRSPVERLRLIPRTQNDGFGLGVVEYKIRINHPITQMPNGWGSAGLMRWNIDGVDYLDEHNSSWWSTTWTRRAPIQINNTGNTATLTHYQTFVNLTHDADMRLDFGDIRIVNETAGTEVPYWIESRVNGSWARIWFNATRIAPSAWTNNTFFVYYGNPTALSTSNGTAVFSFFDDFKGTALDGRWTQMHVSGVTTVSNSIFYMSAGVNLWNTWIASGAPTTSIPLIAEWRVRFSEGAINSNQHVGLWDMLNTPHAYGPGPWSGDSVWQGWHDTTHTPRGRYETINDSIRTHIPRTSVLTEFTRLRTDVEMGRVRFFENDVLMATSTTNTPNVPMGVWMGSAQPQGEVWIDWVFIRRFTSPEPTVVVGAEELPVDTIPPTFSHAGHDRTMAGLPTLFHIRYDDNLALQHAGQWIFATNNTGVWVNDTPVNWTATPQWANVTRTLNSTPGLVIGYRWFAFDNASNWNNTPIYALTTTTERIINITQNITIMDTTSREYGALRTVLQDVVPTGAVVREYVGVRAITQILTIPDTISRELEAVRTTIMGIAIIDTISRQLDAFRTALLEVTIIDTVSRHLEAFRTTIVGIAIIDTISRQLEAVRTVAQPIAITTQISYMMTWITDVLVAGLEEVTTVMRTLPFLVPDPEFHISVSAPYMVSPGEEINIIAYVTEGGKPARGMDVEFTITTPIGFLKELEAVETKDGFYEATLIIPTTLGRYQIKTEVLRGGVSEASIITAFMVSERAPAAIYEHFTKNLAIVGLVLTLVLAGMMLSISGKKFDKKHPLLPFTLGVFAGILALGFQMSVAHLIDPIWSAIFIETVVIAFVIMVFKYGWEQGALVGMGLGVLEAIFMQQLGLPFIIHIIAGGLIGHLGVVGILLALLTHGIYNAWIFGL